MIRPGATESPGGSHLQLRPLVDKVRHSCTVARVMASDDRCGAGGLAETTPRSLSRDSTAGGWTCSMGAGVAERGSVGSAAYGDTGSAVGGRAECLRADHGCITSSPAAAR